MDFTHTITVSVTDLHCDRFGRCKPSFLLRFAQDAAEAHCLELGADWDTLAAKGIFWAVVRQRLEVTRMPRTGQTITVRTWPMPTTKVAFPRATAGFDAEGNELFKMTSLWVVVDMNSRTMIRSDRCGVEVLGTTFGTELPVPGSLTFKDLPNETTRRAGFSELDINGHVNNARYLDWLCDLLPSAFHKDHPMKAVTISYVTEALEGQQVSIHWEHDTVLKADGSVQKTDEAAGNTRIFAAQMEF